MPFITLITDWGNTDYYVPALKGEIFSVCPDATITDITHAVLPYNLVQGAFIFKNSWHHFPKGTVHVIGLSSMSDEITPLVAMQHHGHYFLGADNGFFSLVFDEMPGECYYVLDAKGSKVATGLQVLASASAYLAKGGKLSDMGVAAPALRVKAMLQPVTEENVIRGSVIYADFFGNITTNIDRTLFERIARTRDFDIIIRSKEYTINEISNDYLEAGRGNMLALYNEAGYLEIAISHGNAAGLLGLEYGDIIRVEFK